MSSQDLWDLTAESWYEYSLTPDERPSIAVVRTVSALMDVQVEAMRPLAQVIDPTAIDTLLQECDVSTARIEFVFCGCEVCATSHTIYVREASRSQRN